MKAMLFTPQMAGRVFDDAKDVTRRPIGFPIVFEWIDQTATGVEPYWRVREMRRKNGEIYESGSGPFRPDDAGFMQWLTSFCPYQAGERCFIAEEHYRYGHWEPVGGVRTKGGRQKWAFVADSDEVRYSDGVPVIFSAGIPPENARKAKFWQKRLARFMPADLARGEVEIVSVRPERVQEITGHDALREGITREWTQLRLARGFAGCDEAPEHWVHGDDADEGLSYCLECCRVEVARLKAENPKGDYAVAGGWGTDGDHTPFCETCGKRLSNTLTDYGAEEEFDHFLEHGFSLDSADDCLDLCRAIDSQPWPTPDFVHWGDHDRARARDRHDAMHRLCFQVLWQSIYGPESWTRNDWVWRVEFTLHRRAGR